jgi:hypothetical protein
VGFGWAAWGNTAPVEDTYQNADGNAIYYDAKVIDGEPKAEDGSSVRSGAKAMQNRKRLSAYAFASSIDQVVEWLTNHGPVVFGTNWTNDMFTKDADGFVHPTGSVAGGHCYTAIGYHPAKVLGNGKTVEAIEYDNSWGTWGRFFMTVEDAAKLLASQGEACLTLELPVS